MRGEAVFVHTTRRKICDVRFVPHSCSLFSLMFLNTFPCENCKNPIILSHRLIHVLTCFIGTTTSVSTPHTPLTKIHTIPTSYQHGSPPSPLPSSPFRTNNPLCPLRQPSPSRQRKSICCNRPNYPNHAVSMSSLHQETNGVP